MKTTTLSILSILALTLVGCGEIERPNSTEVQARQQERVQSQAISSVGMPGITNFFEMRTLKRIYEMRDQADLQTYTYSFNGYTGKYVFIGRSVGYGIPAATQYTNPQRALSSAETQMLGNAVISQADPNGLYSPQSANATWVLLQNPAKPSEIKPCYFEQDIEVLPFPMDPSKVQ